MKNIHSLRALVLNADYQPLGTFPPNVVEMKKAVKLIVKQKADILESWAGVFACSGSTVVPMPKVLLLRTYVNIHSEPKFNRRGIFLRDRYRCQYCGQRFDSHDLTYDHVIPRASGGKTVWQNVVTACIKCNAMKANSLPHYSGRKGVVQAGRMRPLKEPRRPTNAELLRAGLEFLPNDLKESFGDFLYWSSELYA